MSKQMGWFVRSHGKKDNAALLWLPTEVEANGYARQWRSLGHPVTVYPGPKPESFVLMRTVHQMMGLYARL